MGRVRGLLYGRCGSCVVHTDPWTHVNTLHCIVTIDFVDYSTNMQTIHHENNGWRHGVAVERRIRDREVAGSGLGLALRRKNSGQVSHTDG